MTTLPIHGLFAEDTINPNESLSRHPADVVASADVVLAQDVMTGRQALVYGRNVLEAIPGGKMCDVAQNPRNRLDMSFIEEAVAHSLFCSST